MQRASLRWLALVAFAAGCSANQTHGGGDDSSGVTPDPQPSGKPTGGKGGGGGSCKMLGRPGDVVATFDVAPGGNLFDKVGNIAVSTSGRIALALTSTDAVPGSSVVLGPDGSVLACFPFGRVVAADTADHLFIAGGFTTAIDFGLGVLTPNGNIDAFVVEVDASGKVIAQFQLGECGDGVTSIAVSADGRIAVSGTAMGTVVVDASGKQLFVVDFAGAVAFDAQGNLVVFGAAADLALVTFDRAGNRLATTTFPSSGPGGSSATSVAVGANGAIAIGGYTTGSVDLFGTAIRARFVSEAGRVSGSFAAMIDATGNPVLVGDLGGMETNGVAIDAAGNLVVAGTTLSNAFFRQSVLSKFDAAGILVLSVAQLGNTGPSASHGVAVDACNTIFVSVDAGRSLLDVHKLVVELAP